MSTSKVHAPTLHESENAFNGQHGHGRNQTQNTTSTCCEPVVQETCCEPSDKALCCGTAENDVVQSQACGCQ